MGSLYVCFTLLLLALEAGAEEGWFWHMTDFHWDFSYWDRQLSCHGFDLPNPGKYGEYWCDAPWELVQGTVEAMKNIKHDVDFIMWTGDTAPHVDAAHLSQGMNEYLILNVTTLLTTQFPATPVYPTLGNNDYYRAHMFPPHGSALYNSTLSMWRHWITDPAQDQTFITGGYYTLKTASGLRIVALNTNLYYTKDTLTAGIVDPAGQFAWFDRVLTDARIRNEKVIVTGHVPPGYTTPRAVRWMQEAFNVKFNEIVLRHYEVIVAMHFGHEHHDSFRLYYNSAGIPVVAVFVAPSVTPWRYVRPTETAPPHNPGVRLIKYDRQTGKHLDIVQYYVDLPETNAAGILSWNLGYTTTYHYGIADVSPESLDLLVKKMVDPSSDEFRSYVDWYNTKGDKNFPCNDTCHRTMMCGLHFLEDWPFQHCLTSGSICRSPFCNFVG